VIIPKPSLRELGVEILIHWERWHTALKEKQRAYDACAADELDKQGHSGEGNQIIPPCDADFLPPAASTVSQHQEPVC